MARMTRPITAISEETGRNKTLLNQEAVVEMLNRMMIGCADYFCLEPVSKAYCAVERHARQRLRQWLSAKHKTSSGGSSQFPMGLLHDELGLVRLSRRTSSLPWATP